MIDENAKNFLEELYDSVNESLDDLSTNLSQKQLEWVNKIVEKEENQKAVFTIVISSLTYKSLYPEQDVRLHKKKFEKGYSGRSFDTKNVTPFLQKKNFRGFMKESGWLTRSLEQVAPFNLDFPGSIRNNDVKNAFLQILNDVEENKVNPIQYLEIILKKSIIERNKTIDLINPIESESNYNIEDTIKMLHDHFYFKYQSGGASILPVIAIYSVYECIVDELVRFNGKYLENLASHTSSDRRSGAAGDIMIRNKDDEEIYEVIEVKFGIDIDFQMVNLAYNKIKSTNIQRYYILTTGKIDDDNEINELIKKAQNEHGVQIILNGIFPTIKYYLRLIKNTDEFINNYIENLESNTELNYEHKESWNKILE